MVVKKGTSRKVVLFWKFALKYPKVTWLHPIMFNKNTRETTYSFLIFSKSAWIARIEQLAYGIKCNWKEYIFFLKNPMPILMPTYFSLLGLINIQRAGNTLPNSAEYYRQIRDIYTGERKELLRKDSHVLKSGNNFCNTGGKLQIVDYAGSLTQRWLSAIGDDLYEKFDFSKVTSE